MLILVIIFATFQVILIFFVQSGRTYAGLTSVQHFYAPIFKIYNFSLLSKLSMQFDIKYKVSCDDELEATQQETSQRGKFLNIKQQIDLIDSISFDESKGWQKKMHQPKSCF